MNIHRAYMCSGVFVLFGFMLSRIVGHLPLFHIIMTAGWLLLYDKMGSRDILN